MKIQESFEYTPHPLKTLLKNNGITIGIVAKYLNRNYYYVQKILNGDITPTPELEARLKSLAEKLEKGVRP